jgi:DNA topoisomerase IA
MIQSNSAHEAIEILVDENELEETYQTLAKKQETSANNSYEHMSKTLKTLEAFANANKAGDIKYQSARIILESHRSDCLLELQTHVLDEAGWSTYLSIDKEDCEDIGLTKADLAAIKQNDFDVEVSAPEAITNLTIDDLLSMMDKFMIGRPSTYANILHDITKESKLLDIDDNSVRLTTLGLAMAKHLDSKALEEFSPTFNLTFGQDLEKISAGEETPFNILKKYLPLVAQETDINAFIEKAWHTLSDINIEVY